MMQRFLHWLYVKSGMYKRDMDIFWLGKLADAHRGAIDARILWTLKMLPEITLERARELANDESYQCCPYIHPKAGWIWRGKE